MSGARRRWTFGSWSSIIAVFTVITVVVLSVWLINQSGDAAPRPEGNNDFPVVPDFGDQTPSPQGSDGIGALGSPSPSPSSKSPTPPPAPPPESPKAPALRARYGYDEDLWGTVKSTVVIQNKSGKAVDGWTVVLVLPDGMTVSSAENAQYSVDGQKVTFTPDGNDSVPGGESVEFTFSGPGPDEGDPRVESCRINGKDC